jgi:predicted enzyme related to lactoylglutathione lyase
LKLPAGPALLARAAYEAWSPEMARPSFGQEARPQLERDSPGRRDTPRRFMFPREVHMNRVTGIGGIFFKAKDAKALQAWYRRHLGIEVQDWGGTAFRWTDADGKPAAGTTVWSIAPAESDSFAPSTAAFMVNYRVPDVRALLKVLREEGCNVLDKYDDSEYGKFGWVIDPEGNKIELWEPPADQ